MIDYKLRRQADVIKHLKEFCSSETTYPITELIITIYDDSGKNKFKPITRLPKSIDNLHISHLNAVSENVLKQTTLSTLRVEQLDDDSIEYLSLFRNICVVKCDRLTWFDPKVIETMNFELYVIESVNNVKLFEAINHHHNVTKNGEFPLPIDIDFSQYPNASCEKYKYHLTPMLRIVNDTCFGDALIEL